MPSGERPTLLYIAGFVVPAKAGTQVKDPGFRRGDDSRTGIMTQPLAPDDESKGTCDA